MLAQLALYSPIGPNRMQRFFCGLASDDRITRSVYGPLLETRADDATFQFCATGMYGRYFSQFLKERDDPFSFVDIGANIGIYSLIAASNPNCHRCYAFEPNPEVFASLQRNVSLNRLDKLLPRNVAISSKPETLRFTVDAGHTGGGTISDEGTLSIQAVDFTAFDEIADADRYPKIVKIDVEGHEPVVVEQLQHSRMWPSIQYLYFEASADRYDVDAVRSSLAAAGLIEHARNGSGPVYDLMYRRAK
jgi:FkbM family methyltransferase